MTTDEKYMKEAIRQAKKAKTLDEVPIGCVIVYEDKIIARGYNRRNTDKNTLSHAELNAIRKASKKLGDWRLECSFIVRLAGGFRYDGLPKRRKRREFVSDFLRCLQRPDLQRPGLLSGGNFQPSHLLPGNQPFL